MEKNKNNEIESEKDEQLKSLIDLAQLDIDAILAYDQAIERIENEDIRQTLERFREDHSRHVTRLSTLIASLGGSPPPMIRDVTGFFIEGMTAITSNFGLRGALLAMAGNEVLTTSKYREALALGLPPEHVEVIEKNYGDETRHLGYIKNTLKRLTAEAREDEAYSDRHQYPSKKHANSHS